MKLKTYKFDETVQDFNERFSFTLPRTFRCPYCVRFIPVNDDTKVFSRMTIGDSYLIVESKCPHCGKTHYRLLYVAHFSMPTIEAYQCLAAHVMYPIDKKELETYAGVPVEKILSQYDYLWNTYRNTFVKNYTLHYSYKKKFPKDKLYTSLTHIPFDELSSTAKQICEMYYNDYPIEALLVSLDMVEE